MWDEWDRVTRNSDKLHKNHRHQKRSWKCGVSVNRLHTMSNDIAYDETGYKYSFTRKTHMQEVIMDLHYRKRFHE